MNTNEAKSRAEARVSGVKVKKIVDDDVTRFDVLDQSGKCLVTIWSDSTISISADSVERIGVIGERSPIVERTCHRHSTNNTVLFHSVSIKSRPKRVQASKEVK